MLSRGEACHLRFNGIFLQSINALTVHLNRCTVPSSRSGVLHLNYFKVAVLPFSASDLCLLLIREHLLLLLYFYPMLFDHLNSAGCLQSRSLLFFCASFGVMKASLANHIILFPHLKKHTVKQHCSTPSFVLFSYFSPFLTLFLLFSPSD